MGIAGGLRVAALAVAIGNATAMGPLAEPAPHIFGALTLSLDDRIWSVVPEGQSRWRLDPVEDQRRKFAPIHVRVEKIEGATTCGRLAEARLGVPPYTTPTSSEIVLSGIRAVRSEAHTGCRNATPRGVVVCIPNAGFAHIFAQTISGCRAGVNPFSKGGIDQVISTVQPTDR